MKELLKKAIPTRLQQIIRSVLFRRRLRTFDRRVVEHNYLGYALKVSLQDELARGWYDHDWNNMAELEILQRSRLKPGAMVFDIGAHQALVAMILAKIVGLEGTIVAVEGTKHNVRVAKQNCELNGLDNVIVLHAVGAALPGVKVLFSETLNGTVDGKRLPVKVSSVSIDSLGEKYGHPDVVFIDVEGYESHVLAGAQKTIARGADFFVEVHAGAGLERFGSVSQVLSNFDASAYCVFWSAVEGADFKLLTPEDVLPGRRFFIIALARSLAQRTA